jgi:hypothetical protein
VGKARESGATPGIRPRGADSTESEIEEIVAFLHTLTDTTFPQVK